MIEITIHGTSSGTCALSGKDGEGMTITFKDGTIREGFLSHRAFQQLIKMKLAQPGKAETKPGVPLPAAVPASGPIGNGAPVVK